jgi:hypothetical protein
VQVEPVGEVVDVPEHGEPSVLSTRVNDQFNGRADLPGAGLVPLGLVERHEGVGIPVVNQGGRNPGVKVENAALVLPELMATNLLLP